MGQRLVITVKDARNGKDPEYCLNEICKMYFHWSAYTVDALYTTGEILSRYYSPHYQNVSAHDKIRFIRICEDMGGGIYGPDSEFVRNNFKLHTFKDPKYISRNDGLIALSPDDKKDMQWWSEGDVEVILTDDCNPVINFQVICYLTKEEYEEIYEEKPQNIPVSLVDPYQFRWDQLPYVIKMFCDYPEFKIMETGEIVCSI